MTHTETNTRTTSLYWWKPDVAHLSKLGTWDQTNQKATVSNLIQEIQVLKSKRRVAFLINESYSSCWFLGPVLCCQLLFAAMATLLVNHKENMPMRGELPLRMPWNLSQDGTNGEPKLDHLDHPLKKTNPPGKLPTQCTLHTMIPDMIWPSIFRTFCTPDSFSWLMMGPDTASFTALG